MKMPEKTIFLCAISNISSGSCSEDCSFCTQSVKYKADIDRYKYKSIDDIVDEAIVARKNQAVGFCLVTSGKGMSDSKLQFVSQAAREIKKRVPDLNLIACNGTASVDDLKVLKEAGISSYNHNLESSRKFYSNICTTHDWDERYQTCLNVKEAGLDLCSGGIFGMGESLQDRLSMIVALKELSPSSVAINFFHPNEALPIKENNMNRKSALALIRYIKEKLPDSMIMVAGGRERMFGDEQAQIFDAGANSIVIGNYLTTKGDAPDKDIELLKSLGLQIAKNCHD